MTAIAINSASARLSGLPAQGGPQDGPARAARLAAALVGARGVAVLERDRAEQPGEWRLLAAEGAPIEPARLRAAAEAACASVREEAVYDGALAYQIGRSADEARTALILDLGVDLGADLGASPCDAEATARARLAAESARDALGRVRAERALCATRRALSRSVEDLSTAARLANIGIWSYDVSTGQMTWSPELYRMYRIEPDAPLTPEQVLSFHSPEDAQRLREALRGAAEQAQPFDLEQKALIDGAEKWVRVLGQPVIEDDAIVSLRGCVQDVTEEVQTREDMTLLATRDYLTEVANRASFTNLFEAMVKSCDFTQHSLYLFIIDVDHFKNINDSFGHDVGDQVLREVTQILFAAVRGSDVVGRLGGDEFGVFVSGARGAQLGDVVGDRIIEMTEQCETLRKINGGVTLSIGYAEAEGSTASFKSTLKAADLALYDAKRAGRNRAVRYRRELGDEYEKRERVLSEVAEALQREEILPYYQLKVGLQDGRVDGFEALARWDHPTRGVLTPWSFWDALCDLRLATRISETVLAQAARDAGRLRRLGLQFGRIAVNVTEKQIAEPSFPARFKEVAESNGVSCADFDIEVTEAVLLARNVDGIRSTMEELCRLGVTLSLDDFGTGYASLTHLRDFPIHTIKIDQSFIKDIETNRESRVIANAVIRMAHDLQLSAVAEGVETDGAAAILRDMGCDSAQGYFFGRPEPFQAAPIACAERAGGRR